MFEIPFVHKNIEETLDINKAVNEISEHCKTLKMPNPWAKQSHVITSIAAGAEDAWQSEDILKACMPVIKEYVDKAVYIAKNKEYLNQLKNKLFTSKDSNPLFDNKSFAHNIEKASSIVFEKHINEKDPEDIYL